MTDLNICKGEEIINFLKKKYNNNYIVINGVRKQIRFFIIEINIPRYKDNIQDFINHIKIYQIHGLLFLNKWEKLGVIH